MKIAPHRHKCPVCRTDGPPCECPDRHHAETCAVRTPGERSHTCLALPPPDYSELRELFNFDNGSSHHLWLEQDARNRKESNQGE